MLSCTQRVSVAEISAGGSPGPFYLWVRWFQWLWCWSDASVGSVTRGKW